jgi:hypothetical protein
MTGSVTCYVSACLVARACHLLTDRAGALNILANAGGLLFAVMRPMRTGLPGRLRLVGVLGGRQDLIAPTRPSCFESAQTGGRASKGY